MEMTKLVLRKNLRELRKERGWNQEVLAEKSGYTPGFIADVERGKSWVSPEALDEISKAFKVPIDRLFETGQAAPTVSLPVSKILTKMMAVPDEVYEWAEKIGSDSDAWKLIIKLLEREAKKKIKKSLANQA